MVDRLNTLVLRAFTSLRRDDGQAVAEYALILAVIAVGVIGTLVALKLGITGKLNDTASKIATTPTTTGP
jgi:Flp pilus assembly pilin Flp